MKFPLHTGSVAAFMALLSACSSTGTEPDLGNMPVHPISIPAAVQLTARSELHSDTAVFYVAFRNTSDVAATVNGGICSFAITATGSGGNQWDNRLSNGAGCADVGLRVDMMAGETVERRVWSAAIDDVSRAGHGTLAVRFFFRSDGKLLELAGGSLLVP
jgi:hypothetical protein